MNSFSGIKRRFGRVCESSTDFHFDDLTKQFDRIRSELDAVNRSREDEEGEEKNDAKGPLVCGSLEDDEIKTSYQSMTLPINDITNQTNQSMTQSTIDLSINDFSIND